MKLFFETVYGCELTLEGDNVHHLLKGIEELRALLNLNSYIGFNNYLNFHCDDCVGSSRIQDNMITYIIKNGDETYFLKAVEHAEGVSLRVIRANKELMYNRLVKKLNVDIT